MVKYGTQKYFHRSYFQKGIFLAMFAMGVLIGSIAIIFGIQEMTKLQLPICSTPGWVSSKGNHSCYMVSDRKMGWTEAKKVGHLLFFKSTIRVLT